VEGMYDRQTADDILNLSKNRATDNGRVRTQMAAGLLQARAKLRERLLPDIDDWVKKRAGIRVEAVPISPAVTGTFTTSAVPSVSAVSTPGENNSTPTPNPSPSASSFEKTLSMIQGTPQPAQSVTPEPSPTQETVSMPSPTPVASPGPVESATPMESPKAEESASPTPEGAPREGSSSDVAPSPTASPEPSPTVQKRAIARHSATPKPKPTPTPTPTPKTLIGRVFESLRKANQETSKPTPTPVIRYWATPTPKSKSGAKASPSPTPR